ncbi:CHAD domain-containing protein [Aestuariimicrobium sp. Y1814]|uniref:CYTH and CHAD domain-containing protein n=1 Tax=Aestuariimicrobium sp. Y1814 TaxID=3418742 RepID=UPI003DA73EA0
MPIETERKYTLDQSEDLVGEDLHLELTEPWCWGEQRSFRLVADYVDTPDMTLMQAGYTLRRRTGGADEGWHLKCPRAGDSRVEVHAGLAAGRSAARVPHELRARLDEVVGLDVLVPVAELVTHREERAILREGSGVVVVLLADDRVVARGGAGGALVGWREVEVELVDGTPDDLDAIEQVLLAQRLSRSSAGPKLAHALGMLGGDTAWAAARGGPTGAEVVLAHLRRQVGAMQGWEPKTRSDEPDAVHKHRVACRRLRSTLRSFRGLFDRSVTDPIRDEVRWLGEQLGAPRDAEVVSARILADLAELEADEVVGDVRDRLPAALEHTHAEAHAALVVALDSERHDALMEALVGLLLDPPLRPERAHQSAKKVRKRVSKTVTRRVERAREAALAGSGDQPRWELLHEVRKKAKAARYAHEVFDDQAEVTSRWEAVTETLGEVQDCTVTAARLRELADQATDAGQPTGTYEVLEHRQLARGREALAEAEDALRAVSDSGRT